MSKVSIFTQFKYWWVSR